jgi:hypothetical protein
MVCALTITAVHATVVIKVNFVMSIVVAMAMGSAILRMKLANVIKDTLLWQINAHSILLFTFYFFTIYSVTLLLCY